jgi:carboxypeptidase T
MESLKYLLGLILFFILLTFQDGYAHNKVNPLMRQSWKMVASIQLDNFQQGLQEIANLDMDIAGVDYKNKIVDVLVNDEQFLYLDYLGYKVTISETKGVTRKPDSEYKNPDEIETILKDFNARYPDLSKLVEMGKSLEGRSIWAIKISDNADLDEYREEPAVLFNSMHHAREIMTPEVSLDIVEYLLTNYQRDSKVTDWVNKNEIWVIPMFNVDGNNKMWNYDSWWRKNTRGGYGVDLNRNYPTGWDSCNGSSGNRRSQTYRGDKPASEPETQAMMQFIADVRPVFDISYHSYSEIVIFPFGCGDKRTQTKEVVEKIGKQIGKLLDYEAGTAWELLYNADGGDIDWMYDAYQVIPYVIELNSRKEGFHPRYKKWRDKTVKRNRPGWQFLLDKLEEGGIRGMVTTKGLPLSGYTITVNKVGKNGARSLFQNYVGHKTGMFHLILNPGTYELVFNGNKNQIKKVLEVKSTRVEVNVDL